MNNALLDRVIADTKPELRRKLFHAFYAAAARVDRIALADAIQRHDWRGILVSLGIADDGRRWPSLEEDVRDALAGVLVPAFSTVALDTWEALGADPAESHIDTAPLDEALSEATTTILRDTLDGIQRTVTLVLNGLAHGLGAAHVVAAIGLSGKQAALFIAANRNAVRLQDLLESAPRDEPSRASIVRDFLSQLPALIASPIRKLIAQGDGRFGADDIRVLSKNLARGLLDYRANAVAEVQAATIANLAEVTTWREAQRLGVLSPDARKFWITRHDERVRHSHAAIESMNGDGVALDATFANTLGKTLFAPPAEINCRCRLSLSKH